MIASAANVHLWRMVYRGFPGGGRPAAARRRGQPDGQRRCLAAAWRGERNPAGTDRPHQPERGRWRGAPDWSWRAPGGVGARSPEGDEPGGRGRGRDQQMRNESGVAAPLRSAGGSRRRATAHRDAEAFDEGDRGREPGRGRRGVGLAARGASAGDEDLKEPRRSARQTQSRRACESGGAALARGQSRSRSDIGVATATLGASPVSAPDAGARWASDRHGGWRGRACDGHKRQPHRKPLQGTGAVGSRRRESRADGAGSQPACSEDTLLACRRASARTARRA